jgi:hypothetical protein
MGEERGEKGRLPLKPVVGREEASAIGREQSRGGYIGAGLEHGGQGQLARWLLAAGCWLVAAGW